MDFRTRRVIFTSPFIMLFEFFVIKYLFLLFGGIDEIYLVLITIFFGCLNIGPMLFESKKSRVITRLLDEFSGIWILTSIFILFDLLIIYGIGNFIDVPMWFIILSLIVVLFIMCYSYYNAHNLHVKEKVIRLNNLTEDINVVHLSDVHFGTICNSSHINKLSNELNKLSKTCDLAIISGDLADGSCVVDEDDFLPLKNVDMPIIFTPGNHDFYPGIENVYAACKKANIIILDNKSFKWGPLNIFGLTFSFGDFPTMDMEDLKNVISDECVNIINFHVPQNWEEFSSLGFDIQLSGHTHGGQFYPVIWVGNYIWYNMGLFKRTFDGKVKYLHVTTGVGVMDYPMRLGTNSELVVLKLRKK